tara:strand:- start:284 stop:697 length:414 start_codon:yes stop_codon:yes gene_type:complete
MPPTSKAVINDENLVDVVYKYKIITLIDITNDTAKYKKHTKKFYQNQNYNTFLQACSLRTQIFEPVVTKQTIGVDNLFGKSYVGQMPIWTLNFYTEFAVPELSKDITGIPVHDIDAHWEVIDTECVDKKNTVIKIDE